MATIGLPVPARRPEFEVNVRCGTPSHSQITHDTAIGNLKSDHSCHRAVPGRPGALARVTRGPGGPAVTRATVIQKTRSWSIIRPSHGLCIS
jgi:hypothetical protein